MSEQRKVALRTPEGLLLIAYIFFILHFIYLVTKTLAFLAGLFLDILQVKLLLPYFVVLVVLRIPRVMKPVQKPNHAKVLVVARVMKIVKVGHRVKKARNAVSGHLEAAVVHHDRGSSYKCPKPKHHDMRAHDERTACHHAEVRQRLVPVKVYRFERYGRCKFVVLFVNPLVEWLLVEETVIVVEEHLSGKEKHWQRLGDLPPGRQRCGVCRQEVRRERVKEAPPERVKKHQLGDCYRQNLLYVFSQLFVGSNLLALFAKKKNEELHSS